VLHVLDIGLITVVWGISAIIFRDWVVRFDLAMRERITGDYFTDQVIDEQRRLLDRTARIVLGAGLLVFALGAGLHFAGLAG
jgi:hypothetical protein